MPLCAPVNVAGRADISDQGPSAELRIETPGFEFRPTYVKAAAGQEVAITLVNTQDPGSFGATHSFNVTELDLGEVVMAGETNRFTLRLPEGGEPVVFFCAIGGAQGHRAAGMQGGFYFD